LNAFFLLARDRLYRLIFIKSSPSFKFYKVKRQSKTDNLFQIKEMNKKDAINFFMVFVVITILQKFSIEIGVIWSAQVRVLISKMNQKGWNKKKAPLKLNSKQFE